jgi:hypothetical protein
MPALIGGYLRRINNYIKAVILTAFTFVKIKWVGLIGVALANEPGLLGPKNRGNPHIS